MSIRRAAVLVLALASAVSAQPGTRRATNLEALTAFPSFYHLRPVVIAGNVKLMDSGVLRLSSESTSVQVVYKGSAPEGMDEVRGEFWDLGRMNADDPRLAELDLQRTFNIDPTGVWPKPGQVTAVIASAIAPAAIPAAPTIRNLVLFPDRYTDQRVTITGQFGGRNLLGDLPDAPAVSRYDFVLRSADGAIWITNIRPRGKDFELALDARIDTGRWLQVTGTVRRGRGLQWLDAEAGTLALTKAPQEAVPEAPIQVPAAPPPEVIFSAPTQDEVEVPTTTSIRIQFSRDIDPRTFSGQIRVGYANRQNERPAAAMPDNLPFTTQYLPGSRVLELRFPAPLERFRTLSVELRAGILGRDAQALVPWTLTFETGP